MNAPLPLGHMAEHKIEWLPIGAIAPSDTAMQSLRRERILRDEAELAGLAASIRTDGIWSPIVVRKLLAMRDMAVYELVAGERRWRAAQLAGMEHVPAIVRELEDNQVLRAQLTENIQRKTLSALEEAEGYRELIASEKTTVDGIVPIVGKSRSWIYDRLKLLDLIPEAREALLAEKIDAYSALAVARTKTKKLQAKALSIALQPGMTVRELKSRLTGPGFTAHLVHARFPISDVTLNPPAGACGNCPSRTGNGSEFDASEDDPDICTDVACFEAKGAAHQTRLVEAARASGKAVLTDHAAREIAPKPDQLIGHVDLDAGFDEADIEISEREAPQPRTWRSLLESLLKEGEDLEPVLIEDPRDHRLRQLVPLDRVKRLLKRKGIVLPTWLGSEPKPDDAPAPAAAGLRVFGDEPSVEDTERRERAEAAQRERQEKELAHRRRVACAIYARRNGKLTKADWLAIADGVFTDVSGNYLRRTLFPEGVLLPLEDLGERELQTLILLGVISPSISNVDESPAPLFALARRTKIDPAKYKAEPKAKAAKASAAKKKSAKPTKKSARR